MQTRQETIPWGSRAAPERGSGAQGSSSGDSQVDRVVIKGVGVQGVGDGRVLTVLRGRYAASCGLFVPPV